jgi:hypothetical protein
MTTLAVPSLACAGRGLWTPPDRPGPDLLDNSPCGWTGLDARVCPECGGRVRVLEPAKEAGR